MPQNTLQPETGARTPAGKPKDGFETEAEGEDGQNKESGNLGSLAREEKFNSTIWLFLFSGAILVDLVQGALAFLVIGILINQLIDIFIGLTLFTVFGLKKMLDWKATASLLAAFGFDSLSGGVLPAWSLDIAYIWFITDGSKNLGKIPIAGDKIKKAAIVAIQKKNVGKGFSYSKQKAE